MNNAHVNVHITQNLLLSGNFAFVWFLKVIFL